MSTVEVGRYGRTVNEVAGELGFDWHTVNNAVIAYGAPSMATPTGTVRLSPVGSDETLFCREGRWRAQVWSTSVVDVDRRAAVCWLWLGSSAGAPRPESAHAITLPDPVERGGARGYPAWDRNVMLR